MKKLTLLSLCIMAFTMLFAQTVPSNWEVITADISVTEETTTVNEGTKAMSVTWTSTANQDIRSAVFTVTPGATFSYTLDVYDNDAAGRVRMAIAWTSANGFSEIYSEDQANWQTLTYTGTVPAEATSAQILLRFYDVSGSWSGTATVIVDNAIYAENGGSNLILNPSFETWELYVPEPTLTVTSPSNGSTVSTDNVDLTFSVENFVLGTDGKVEYKLNGGSAMYTTTSPINVTGLVVGSNTLDVQLVDMSNVALDPVVAISRTFTYEIPSTDPALTITSPTSGASVYSQDVNIAFTLENFVLGTDGKLAYSVDGGADVMYVGASPLALTGLSYAAHTVDFEFVDMAEASLTTPVTASLNFTCVEALPGGMETFDNLGLTGTTYTSGTFVGQDGSTWTFDKCRGDYSITDKSIMIGRNQTPVSYFESGSIDNGIGVLNFDYMQGFGTNVNLNVYVNGDLVGNVTSSGEQSVIKNSGDITINVAGSFIIKFMNANTSDGQVVVDNISWSTYGSTDPYITITSPANSSTVNSADVDIAFTSGNFDLGTEGSVKYIVDGGSALYATASPIALTGLTDGSHTVSVELVDMANASLTPTVIDEVTFTVNTAAPSTTPIYDIQYTTAGDGASPLATQTVTTRGVVIAKNSDKFWLQDGAGAWNGLYIYNTTTPSPVIGDSVLVEGTVLEFNGLTEISPVSSFSVINSSNTIAAATTLSTTNAAQEMYEGVLVTVTGVCMSAPDTYGVWPINDGSGVVYIDDIIYDFEPTAGNSYTITGVQTFSYNQWVVLPRDASDVIDNGVSNDPLISITSPANGATIYSASTNVTFTVSNFTLGTDGKVAWNVDGAADAYVTASPIAITGLTEGAHIINLELVDMSNNALTEPVTSSISITVDFSGPATTPIYDIQYTTAGDGSSPLSTQAVTTRGVVFAKNSDKFWLQDGAGAWNGLYIYNSTTPSPVIGDSVFVSGTVYEFNGLTELSPVTSFSIINSSNTIAAATSLSTNNAAQEMYEGVLVEVTGVCLGAPDNFGVWPINDGSGVIYIDDIIYDFEPTVGNSYTITGVQTFSYDQWVILPRDAADVTDNGVSTEPLLIVSSPADGSIVYADNTNVVFTVSNFVLGTDGKVAWNVDGAADAYVTASPIAITGLTEGVHTINLELVDMSNASLSPAVTVVIDITVNLAGPVYTNIYDIQYTTELDGESPMIGDDVWIRGVVTASFNATLHGEGYYVQQGGGAWNSIYVYDLTNIPAIGDSVKIAGTVDEYYTMTQIESVTYFEVSAPDGTVAAPAVVSFADANSEGYESCLIKVQNGECTVAQNNFGEWTINDGTTDVKCQDNGAFSFVEEVGKHYDVIGVTFFSYGVYELNYRIESDITEVSSVDSEFANSISLYPNPASDKVTINIPMGAEVITITNTLGQTVAEISVSAETTIINTENYEAGVYFVKIVNNTDSAVLRLVIE